ncbi:hypothetical protein BJX76DRAFT_357848 [Aspergillus varians]
METGAHPLFKTDEPRRIVIVVRTEQQLNPDNYLAAVHTIIDDLAPGWHQDERIKLVAVDIYPGRTYIAIDVNNREYDFQTVHETTAILPAYSARIRRRTRKWLVMRGQPYDSRVADDSRACTGRRAGTNIHLL